MSRVVIVVEDVAGEVVWSRAATGDAGEADAMSSRACDALDEAGAIEVEAEECECEERGEVANA